MPAVSHPIFARVYPRLSAAFDAAVVALVLCTVPDQAAALTRHYADSALHSRTDVHVLIATLLPDTALPPPPAR
ncbi:MULTISPECIES: hypothetical protein [unclassified Frankia]